MKKIILKISGKVQGVFFRENAKRIALQKGLVGQARNCSDGRVEIIAEGEETDLNELLKWAQEGPEPAQVDGVLDSWQEATGEFHDFQVK